MSEDSKSFDRKGLTERLDIDFALQAAGLGVWELDPVTNRVQWDDRCRELFGISRASQFDFDETLNYVYPGDVSRIQQAAQQAMTPGSSGIYKVIYRTIRENGEIRWIRSTGRSYFNEAGQVVRFAGVVQDVTEEMLNRQKLEESEERYRTLTAQLEQQVEERTQELEAANEELAAVNEELSATNDSLAESNQLLSRTNLNLEQFAYVASHDLQEPLRKVQQFGDVLKSQYASQLGPGVAYLDRMRSAASRMSALIRDLLTFSRIATQKDSMDAVALNRVIDSVLTDLELIIGETGAIIDVDRLPTLHGDALQLGQLFQNLLSNALKFRHSGRSPQIRIRYGLVAAGELPPGLRPTRVAARYHSLEISDNGIGFDEKYADQIFQVFQRLHGRSQYEGTGIGLAICQKVVDNHGGAISARSRPGEGATFSIYLPA
ncbi:ATP-binding protein [Larkinella insperata]|uniref:histidine kinase n=1 Tax=Larkinella insperata TaxID=332158 RepID=A0ABW3QKC3_9BACT|nr:ATP-binding protein [Larkinella insperata]